MINTDIEHTQHAGFGEISGQALQETVQGAVALAAHVVDIQTLLGDAAILLPVPWRQKSPSFGGWQNITREQTRTPEYQHRLSDGNIVVLLGAPSAGVCTIDIDDDDEVEPFLELNPKLRQGLRTKGRRGEQLWLQVEGEHPKLNRLVTTAGDNWGEFRADGGQSIISGIHPDGMEYQMVSRAQPVRVRMEDLQWPAKLKLPWIKTEYDRLVEDEGEPFVETEGGGIKGLNDMFFVEKFHRENVVLFDAKLRDFYLHKASTGLWRRTTEDTIKSMFLSDFKATAKELKMPGLLLKRTHATASNWLNLLRGHVEKMDAFGGKKLFAHVRNGVIRLDEEQFDLVTNSHTFYSRNRAPFDYDPNARCDRFLNELLQTALDDDDILLFQKWAGSVLLGRNIAQKILLMIGTAGGGKSTLMSVIEAVIGLDNVTQLRTEHLADRFELFRFDGKTLLTGKDVSPTFLMRKGAMF